MLYDYHYDELIKPPKRHYIGGQIAPGSRPSEGRLRDGSTRIARS